MSPASSLGELVDSVSGADLDTQRISWSRVRWRRLEATCANVLDRIDAEVSRHGTISRSWLRGLVDEPMTLLVATMIWGFGPDRYGPSKLERMLTRRRTDAPIADVVTEIVAQSQHGAGRGFTALFDSHGDTRVMELGVAFGTKLVHFAGYDTASDPRPLVYDLRVWSATEHLDDCPTFPSPRGFVATADYERYCAWAGDVAAERELEPAIIEYALFRLGGELKPRRLTRDRAPGSR